MILGQLIQTGRHFCECRSNDFVPKSEDTVVVIAYSIHDTFLAHSFDTSLYNLTGAIKTWLFNVEPVGYLLVQRKSHGFQHEFPSPIGRDPMDQVTLTAATHREFEVVSFFLEEIEGLDAYRLVPTSCTVSKSDEANRNLFQIDPPPSQSLSRELFPEFSNSVG